MTWGESFAPHVSRRHRYHGHFGEPIGTFGHGQFFQLPPSPIQADPPLAGEGLPAGGGEFVVSLAALGGEAKRWST